ncbi:hypothetical protein G7054_g11079 [Neopestalotiopsis clavispora]|nr:hypothetical protein G7054_g11079 [Neopestalotiopsis clavispora]
MLRRFRGFRRSYIAVAALAIALTTYLIIYSQQDVYSLYTFAAPPKWLGRLWTGTPKADKIVPLPAWKKPDNHTISKLVDEAQQRLPRLLEKQPSTLGDAARRYRERRGRHPPPGFDAWYKAAEKHDAVIVEEFFDRVYDDINPFWAKDPAEMRRLAHAYPQRIQVRNGKVEFFKTDPEWPDWYELWADLMKEMSYLPDLDMAVNNLDETRILVPFEQMEEYIAAERRSRRIFPAHEALQEYTGYIGVDSDSITAEQPHWIGEATKYWDYFRATCPPDSPARKLERITDYGRNVDDVYPDSPSPRYTRGGFVSNATAARDACNQPHLRGMHGTFVQSTTMRTSTTLFPMFGGSKLPRNNEILVPGAEYLTSNEFYSGGAAAFSQGGPWRDKKNAVMWRGAPAAGFTRRRTGSASSGTGRRRRRTQLQPRAEPTILQSVVVIAEKEEALGRLDCFPEEVGFWGRRLVCAYIAPWFAQVATVPMRDQYAYRYLPDVDGNSYSARFRGFLLSSSCVIKATIFAEWHDDRLVPWVHYVPLDSTYMDVYALLEYFIGDGGGGGGGGEGEDGGHGEVAQRIAQEGAEWARRALRREDMMLYTWRALLEYARVVDPRRDRLGFVKDLLKQ